MKSDEELTGAICRMTRALGERCAASDPDTAFYLREVREQLDQAEAGAVAGWRRLGFSDTDIGRELGVTKQAVQKRWPRAAQAAVALLAALATLTAAHASSATAAPTQAKMAIRQQWPGRRHHHHHHHPDLDCRDVQTMTTQWLCEKAR